MNRAFCDCDPAMGYKKEFRMAYQIGETVHELHAEEREHITIDAGGKELKILRAIFGKFKQETEGVPNSFSTYNVTPKILQLVNSGIYNILVNNDLIDNQLLEGNKTVLKITYLTDGEERTTIIPKGEILKLSKDITQAKLVRVQDNIYWVTPYSGQLNYATSQGKSKSVRVKSIPKPIDLSKDWQVSFPINETKSKQLFFNDLVSWSTSNDQIFAIFLVPRLIKKSL